MGRFYKTAIPNYKTAIPNFADNGIYKPDYELYGGVIARLDKSNEEIYNSADLLGNSVAKIEHLNIEPDIERVKKLKDYYNNEIELITEELKKDPHNWGKQKSKIDKLRKEMLENSQNGDWNKIESRAQKVKAWLKENEKTKNSQPDLYNRVYQKHITDLEELAKTDVGASFDKPNIVEKPDILTAYKHIFEKIKAEKSFSKDGKYIYENEEISEEEIAGIAWNIIKSDPQFASYSSQMKSLGDEGYDVNPFILVDKDNKELTYEEYLELPDEEKSFVTKQLNGKNAYANELAVLADTYGYSTPVSMKVDEYQMASHKGSIDSKLAAQKAQVELAKLSMQQQFEKNQLQEKAKIEVEAEKAKHANDLILLKEKYRLMGEHERKKYKEKLKLQSKASAKTGGVNKDKIALEEIEKEETLGKIRTPQVSSKDDFELLGNSKRVNGVLPKDAYTSQQRIVNARNYAQKELKAELKTVYKPFNTLSNVTYTNADYLKFLGNRESTNKTAQEFFNKKIKENSINLDVNDDTMSKTEKGYYYSQLNKLKNFGEKHNKTIEKWYVEEHNKEITDLNLSPLVENDKVYAEINYNTSRYYVVDEDGVRQDKKTKDKVLKDNSSMYAASANSHANFAIQKKVGDKKYFILPTTDDAENLTLKNLTLKSVSNDSQFFKDVSNEVANDIATELQKVGKNHYGTKSKVFNILGLSMNVEIKNDGKVQIYKPTDQMTEKNVQYKFDNIEDFVNAIYYEK